MSELSVSIESVKKDLMLDEEFKEEYEKLQPQYALVSQIIEARNEQRRRKREL